MHNGKDNENQRCPSIISYWQNVTFIINYKAGCINFHAKNYIQVLIILISSIPFTLLMKTPVKFRNLQN